MHSGSTSLYIHYILIEVSHQSKLTSTFSSLRRALLGNEGIFIVARSISLPSFLPFALPTCSFFFQFLLFSTIMPRWPEPGFAPIQKFLFHDAFFSIYIFMLSTQGSAVERGYRLLLLGWRDMQLENWPCNWPRPWLQHALWHPPF